MSLEFSIINYLEMYMGRVKNFIHHLYVVGSVFLIFGSLCNIYLGKNELNNFSRDFTAQFTPFAIILIAGIVILSVWISRIKKQLQKIENTNELTANDTSKAQKIAKKLQQKSALEDFIITVGMIQDYKTNWEGIPKKSLDLFLQLMLNKKGQGYGSGRITSWHDHLTELGKEVATEINILES